MNFSGGPQYARTPIAHRSDTRRQALTRAAHHRGLRYTLSGLRRDRIMFIKKLQFKIQLSDAEGTAFPADLDCETREWNEGGFSHRVAHITLKYADKAVEGSGPDCFEAFCRVREKLEMIGLLPLCYGASRNVFPSGMGRDMGNGLAAYRMTMGRHTTREDLVRIFDSGPDMDLVSVKLQREFFDRWLESPRAKPGI